MNARLTLPVAMLLTVPPLMWSGNAVVGRMVSDLVPPMTLNFLRWFLAFLFLLPFCGRLLRPTSPLWPVWRRFLLLGLLGVGAFNALQYLALRTSSPINVTLVSQFPDLGSPDRAPVFCCPDFSSSVAGSPVVDLRRAAGPGARTT